MACVCWVHKAKLKVKRMSTSPRERGLVQPVAKTFVRMTQGRAGQKLRVSTSSQAMTGPPAHEDDDASLVARCVRGDGAAWAALVQRYQRLVYAIVSRVGLDEHGAADVFQTVFARLVQHLPRIAEPSRLQAWIVTTAKREALLQRTRGQRTVSLTQADESHDEAFELDLTDESPIAEEALAELQQLNQLRAALDRLDKRCRDLLLLLFREDDDKLSYDAVARRLGSSTGSIGPTRSRCLDKLRSFVS
jgi:RNA polymerase sigma factor (sigma-70 family)